MAKQCSEPSSLLAVVGGIETGAKGQGPPVAALLEFSNAKNGTWQGAGPSMAVARAYHGAAVVRSASTGYYALYVVGGSSLGNPTNNTGVLSSVEVFEP